MPNFPCSGLPHGHFQTSVEASHDLLLIRLSLHFLLLLILFIYMTKKCSQMHVGHCHTFLMALMIKFKLLLKLICALNSSCIYCEDPSLSVLIPALRTVGNIVTADDMQTEHIIRHAALPCLLNLLTHNCKSIRKEACWAISNITAGNIDQIQAVNEARIIHVLVRLLQNDEFDIKKEAVWAISNAISGCTIEQMMFLVSQGCIKPLCDLLVCPDPRILTVCLEGLENILKDGEAEKNTCGVNLYTQLIDDAEGFDRIEILQSHENKEIYEKAVKILETYRLEEEDYTVPPGNELFYGEHVLPSGRVLSRRVFLENFLRSRFLKITYPYQSSS